MKTPSVLLNNSLWKIKLLQKGSSAENLNPTLCVQAPCYAGFRATPRSQFYQILLMKICGWPFSHLNRPLTADGLIQGNLLFVSFAAIKTKR